MRAQFHFPFVVFLYIIRFRLASITGNQAIISPNISFYVHALEVASYFKAS